MSRKPWSASEIALLHEKAPVSTIKELCLLFPDRNYASIRAKARKLSVSISPTYTPWFPQELSALEEHYPSSPWSAVMSALPNRSRGAIVVKASELGIRRNTPESSFVSDEWSSSEVTLLKEHYPSSPWDIVCDSLPHRTPKSIRRKAENLGLSRDEATVPWSLAEVLILHDYYPTAPWHMLFDVLPYRSRKAIKRKAEKEGIVREEFSAGFVMVWSDEELALLKEHYPSSSWTKILSLFPYRSRDSIQRKALHLNLHRSVSCDV